MFSPRRYPIQTLVLANLTALGILVGAGDVRAEGGVDACDEGSSEGCDCLCTEIPGLAPWGCYEVPIGRNECENWDDCTEYGGGCNEEH
jgi:hypothetical protein